MYNSPNFSRQSDFLNLGGRAEVKGMAIVGEAEGFGNPETSQKQLGLSLKTSLLRKDEPFPSMSVQPHASPDPFLGCEEVYFK